MRILDAGTEQLSNADVLRWIGKKRKQHREQDDESVKKGTRPPPLPKNLMDALKAHEEILSSPQYHYKKNPSVYGESGKSQYDSLQEFDRLVVEKIILPATEAHQKELEQEGFTKEQIEKRIEHVHETKSLTEAELLMIYNHAPVVVDMMQPMIDSVEERFTQEEQETLIEIIKDTFRKDEQAAQAAG